MADNVVNGIIGDGFSTELLLTAIAKQLKKNPADWYVACKTDERCTQLREQYNAKAVTDPAEFLPKVKILIIALPVGADIEATISEINSQIPADALVISFTYILTIDMLEKYFPGHSVIHGAMNQMILIGEGICIYTVGSIQSTHSEMMAKLFLSQFGKTIKMDSGEEMLLASDLIFVSSMYALMAVNALIEGAENSGLKSKNSTEIVSQVFKGISKFITESDEVIDNLAKHFSGNKKFVELGRDILLKYDILKYMQNQLPKNDEREIFKFHYRWNR